MNVAATHMMGPGGIRLRMGGDETVLRPIDGAPSLTCSADVQPAVAVDNVGSGVPGEALAMLPVTRRQSLLPRAPLWPGATEERI
jgi:hypothetical protein